MIRLKYSYQLILLLCLSMLSLNGALAADWTKTFKEGVNSYTSSGQIRFHSGSKLFDSPTNGNLPSYSVTDFAKSACVPSNGNSKKCKAGRYTVELPSDRIPFEQCASTSNRNLGPSDAVNYVIEVPEGQYSNINSHFYYHTVKFTSNDTGIYRIKLLNIQDGVLELAPGQYWIENLQIAEGVTVRFPPNGTVSFFVKNHFVQYNRLLAYYSDRFLLYGYSDIDLAEDSYFRGYIVSEGKLIFSEEARVEGGVTSDYISIADDGWVEFDDEAWRINVVPNCDVDEPKPPVIPQCPAEQNNIQGLTYRTYDSRPWDTSNNSPANNSQFDGMIDLVKKTRYQIGESIETDLEQSGRDINPHSSSSRDQDLYLGIFEGYIQAPETGLYTFAVDGDDAIELLIDGEVVTGFYNTHAVCNCTSFQGQIALEQGAHTIELRFHESFGSEGFKLYWQPPSSSSLTIVPADKLLTCPAPQFEFGRVELDVNGTAVISFEHSYSAPPIVMVMPTIDGANANIDRSSTVRIDSLTTGNAAIKQINSGVSQVLDKKMDKVDYFVMEPGYRFLARGKALQAGSISTELYQGKNLPSLGRGYDSIDFELDFGLKPAMIGQALSHNNNRFITTVINNVDDNGSDFDIAIEGSEMSSGITRPELLGYVAGVGQGVMTVNGESVKYEFANALNHGNGSSVRSLSQQCAFLNRYEQDYPSQPLTIANKNQRRGGDGGWVRRCTKDSFNDHVSFAIDEDQHSDGERSHLAESIGYFAFEYAAEPPAVNHYRINFSSGALSCALKKVTVQACADSACSSLLSDPAFVTLTKNGSNYTSANVNGSADIEVWHPQGGTVTLGLGNTVPSGDYSCYIDNNLVDNSQCNLTFENSGIYFDIDDSTACKNSSNFELFAVKQDETSIVPQCVPLFANQTKPISMAFNYITPDATGINEAAKLTINSLNAPVASKDIAGGSSEELQVRFDANGKALLNVNYPEAGKVELAATLTEVIESPDGSSSEMLVLEHNDQFVSKPDGFHFFNTSDKNGCAGANCDLFAKAGDDFDMSVKAVCGADGGTPYKDRPALKNFRFTDLNIQPVLQAPLVANGDDKDGVLGLLGSTKLSFDKGNSAPLKLSNQTYSEVGAVSIALDGEVNYLGAAIPEANSGSDIFGRFSPYFLSINANEPSPDMQCGSFTYMDQPFGFISGSEPTLSISGKNKAGAETRNYQIGDWWRYHGKQWSDRSYSDTSGATSIDGAALQVLDESPISGIVDYYPISDDNSVQRAYLSGAKLHYARTASPAVPFSGQFDLALLKSDVTDKDGICYRDTASDNCREFIFEDIAKDDAFAMRYGRLVMQNAYGPSSEELRLELGTEYVNASSQWVSNGQDSCSVFDTTTATLVDDTGLVLTPDAGLGAVEGFTNTGGSGKTGSIGLGNSFIYFPAPNAEGEVGLQLHVDKWLQWYWNFDSAALEDPRASAFFGTYRGHDRIIYWREVN
ncbi:hypothetical protein TUM4261_14490 [Shewanella sp. c952]|uniref:DUF6701 domain-containing protein n=1 Tax=Shewanella sp. c952 TaxID=2815913 RepID=UPI001BC663E2|nr:DUF6701 domain-containing protein [Shewanella sp. c952]GIU08191.1 hypothetical protein TUM4261_14490 [Shewanella sp. c952]